jgi:hypothetical protein
MLRVVLVFASLPSFISKEGIIVIPGIGRSDRLKTVSHNLKHLADFIGGENSLWDCMAYVYAPRNDTAFWQNAKALSTIAKFCDIIDHPYRRVAENLYMVHPTFVERLYKHIFILFDDCKLLSKEKKFDLSRLLTIMSYNNLTVATPKVMIFYSISFNCFR